MCLRRRRSGVVDGLGTKSRQEAPEKWVEIVGNVGVGVRSVEAKRAVFS